MATTYFELVGDPVDGDSWYQRWALAGTTGVTTVQAWVEGWTFDQATRVGFFNWTAEDVPPLWDQYYMSPDYTIAAAGGPAITTTSAYFFIRFQGYRTTADDFTIHLQAYVGDTRVANQDYEWDSKDATWSVRKPSYIPGTWEQNSPIPEPVTMAGLMMGIGVLVTYVRRRRG